MTAGCSDCTFTELKACQLFVALGTYTYGEKTPNKASTFYELEEWRKNRCLNEKSGCAKGQGDLSMGHCPETYTGLRRRPKIIPIRMHSQKRFLHPRANKLFSSQAAIVLAEFLSVIVSKEVCLWCPPKSNMSDISPDPRQEHLANQLAP